MPSPRLSELIDFLLACQALKFGDFTLKSGAKSPFFIDLGHVRTGRQLDTLGGFLAEAMRAQFPETTIVFGPAYKGISLATVAAASSWRLAGRDLGVVFDRKEAKAHGEGGAFIGAVPGPTDRVLLIDDVLTSGLTKREGIDRLRSAFGVTAVDILVVVDRRSKAAAVRDDLAFSSLLDIVSLADHLTAARDARADLIRTWWETAS
jgi:orotate phosphoribosyltransferase